jgi:hypothetical protein
MAKKEKKKPKPKTIPIKFDIPEDMKAEYATNFAVSLHSNEVYLSFFQLKHYICKNPSDVQKEADSHCVANVIISNNRLIDLMEILEMQLQSDN